MKISKLVPALLAAVMVMNSSVGTANAYFTTYVTARGGYSVSWHHKERLEEKFENWHKYVTVTSEEGSIPVYVRATAFSGTTYQLEYSGNDWIMGSDGFYYYKNALNGGETTSALAIEIKNVPVNPDEETNFNVVVVYETIPVQFGADGNMVSPEQADWSETLTSNSEG